MYFAIGTHLIQSTNLKKGNFCEKIGYTVMLRISARALALIQFLSVGVGAYLRVGAYLKVGAYSRGRLYYCFNYT